MDIFQGLKFTKINFQTYLYILYVTLSLKGPFDSVSSSYINNGIKNKDYVLQNSFDI